jgi:hypothetical protein
VSDNLTTAADNESGPLFSMAHFLMGSVGFSNPLQRIVDIIQGGLVHTAADI